jgi:hypothetical protein
LRNRKALDLLIENANITDTEWTEPSTDYTDDRQAVDQQLADQQTADHETAG